MLFSIIAEPLIQEISSERQRQVSKWGQDTNKSSHDWIAYLVKHSGKAVTYPFDGLTFRKQMIRIAALAIAAIEWYDTEKPV